MTNTLTIIGNDQLLAQGGAPYEITVSGETGVSSIDGRDGDETDGRTISGTIQGHWDSYEFTGEITSMTVPDSAEVRVNGQTVSQSDLSSDSGGSPSTPSPSSPSGGSGAPSGTGNRFAAPATSSGVLAGMDQQTVLILGVVAVAGVVALR